jgi:thiosulfate dehydrogenase
MGTAAKAMTGVAVFAAGVAVAMALRPDAQVSKDADTGQPAATPAAWSVPDIDALPDDPWGRTVRHGRDLIAQTAAAIGPEVADPARRLSGNNLNCQSCHLQAGTQQFGLPLVGVFADFPQYRGRSGRVNTLEDRVNGCMTRSMNGKALPEGGEDMVAIVAYLKFLSSGRPVGAPTEGRGSVRLADLARAADPVRGKAVYAQHCAVCHGSDGAGQRAGRAGDAKGYTYPPLWGADSYNNGAGMGRVTTAAGFIRSNMPLGTRWQAPVLSEEQAFDVAAYINSQPRPQRAGLERDYPRLEEKPVDAPYGPYADDFSSEQHRFGPFGPMRNPAKSSAKP